MDAVAAITDKQLGDALRRKVVDTVLDQDVFKGVALAARAGDFNRFSWGTRDWMVTDPAAAVTALATLPAISDCRRFLKYAMPIWAEKDPGAALNWMTSAKALPGDRWIQEGFAVEAEADPDTALAAARSIADSRQRGEALAGVIASGQIDLGTWQGVREEIPLEVQRWLRRSIVDARPAETSSDLFETARLLDGVPLDPDNLSGIDSLASQWARVDAVAGWQWAHSLSQPAARRKALTRLAASATPQQAAELPVLDLSDAFFQSALRARRPSDREAWIGQLPARLAAWAETVNP